MRYLPMYLDFGKTITRLPPPSASGAGGFTPVYPVTGSSGRTSTPYLSITMAVSLLLALGQTGVALAHSTGGALGKKKSATDVYAVTCSNEEGGDTPTLRLAVQVRDELPRRKPKISVTIAKNGTEARTTDKNGDGNRRYSPWAYLDEGNGTYRMSITKSRKGLERYSVEFHCQGPSSSGHIHTATDMVITQNQ